MYTEHPACEPPENPEVKIWRYMNFTRFLSVLENNALFFPNISILSDRLEGYFTKPTVDKILNIPKDLPEEERNQKEIMAARTLPILRMGRVLLYASCWHMNDYESAAMWKIYLESNEGIAIQSTFSRLTKCFTGSEDVSIGIVKYIDYNKDTIPSHNILYPALHKRKSFEHERELRALVMSGENIQGKFIPVNFDVLIDHIYIAPNSQQWFYDLVSRVISRYGIEKTIINSGLDEKPLY